MGYSFRPREHRKGGRSLSMPWLDLGGYIICRHWDSKLICPRDDRSGVESGLMKGNAVLGRSVHAWLKNFSQSYNERAAS